MVRRSRKLSKLEDLESKSPPILQINYNEPLFSSAAHPTEPLLVSGLATGHVFCHRYDDEALEESLWSAKSAFNRINKEDFTISQLKKKWWTEVDHSDSNSTVDVVWKTRRHQGSCRSVIFDCREDVVGESIFSVGTDHIIKRANTETGKVIGKSNLSPHYDDSKEAVTTLQMSTSHPFLLAGTENGQVLVFDSNELRGNSLKFKLAQLHEDSINKILPMPAISPYHYLTLGSTTLAHFDIRKGLITQSDDQSDELLSMCYPNEFYDKNGNDTVLVSHGEGIVTIWKNSVNRLSDQILRIKVNKNASIDVIMPTMNGENSELNCVWCGDSEGLLHKVDYKKSKVVETRVHSATMGKLGGIDEVGCLDIDYKYRLVSSGMEGLKIWSKGADTDSDNDDSDVSVVESSTDSSSEEDLDCSSLSENADSYGAEGLKQPPLISDGKKENERRLETFCNQSDPHDEGENMQLAKKRREVSERFTQSKKARPEHIGESTKNSISSKASELKKVSSKTSKASKSGIQKFDGL